MNQLKIHNRIDEFVNEGTKTADVSTAQEFISVNCDARDFFYSCLSAEWIKWLHKNSFFAVLNEPAADQTSYSYRMPELNYLEKVAAEQPNEVAAIMLEVDCVKNFNPEVVDRFTRITESLSGENLSQVVEKIHRENWVKLMRKFNTWSHAYEAIAKKLETENNVESLILLADTMMSVNADRVDSTTDSNPFVLSHIGDLGILQAFVALEDQAQLEQVYEFLIRKLAGIIGEKKKEAEDNHVFDIEEPYYFFDVDLFNHNFGDKHSASYRDDMENLMAAIVLVTHKIFSVGCDQERKLRGVYEYLNTTMPDSWSGWRLRLFTASFCGELFREELQAMFNRLFEVIDTGKSYYEIESGTEYKKALQRSWPELGYVFKQEYIENIFQYFDPKKFDGEEKNWRTRDALQILQMIGEGIDAERVMEVFGYTLDDERIPEVRPTITRGEFGAVIDRSPVDMSKEEVANIPNLLKTTLMPEVMEQKYKDDPFHNPRNVEGVGTALRADVQERLDEYLDHIADFFSPDDIHRHYTYSVLDGINNVLRNNKSFSIDRWKMLFAVIEQIEQADLKEPEDESKTFLVSWQTVRRNNADILRYSHRQEFLPDEVFIEYRERILGVIVSLLRSDDPKPEYEEGKYGDLQTIGINHTKGVAYQAYIQFLYRDGESLKDDAKQVFADLLDTNTSLSTWAMVGQYLPSVFYRDQDWIQEQLPKLFQKDNPEQYFAAWEGYITASVYKEVFEVMDEYYRFALGVSESEYPERGDRGRDLDEAIGTHLSLAYTHFDNVTLENELIKVLWEESDSKKQSAFISHIGRGIISNNQITAGELRTQKVLELWDWMLDKREGEISREVYGEFGFWVRDKGVEDIVPLSDLAKRFAKTLEFSEGRLGYEFHLKDKLADLAEADAGATLSIMRSLLLGEAGDTMGNVWLRSDAASLEVFKILYLAKPDETAELVNELIEKKGRVFWGLKEVLK